MFRTVRIWLLLRKLQNACHKSEVDHPEHGEETGHNFHAMTSERNFLDKVSKGNKRKRVVYADFLTLAEKKMMFLQVDKGKQKCKDCSKILILKWIRLNEDGLEFIGFLDLIEYILVKYKLTWTLLVLPIVTLIIGLNWRVIIGLFGV